MIPALSNQTSNYWSNTAHKYGAIVCGVSLGLATLAVIADLSLAVISSTTCQNMDAREWDNTKRSISWMRVTLIPVACAAILSVLATKLLNTRKTIPANVLVLIATTTIGITNGSTAAALSHYECYTDSVIDSYLEAMLGTMVIPWLLGIFPLGSIMYQCTWLPKENMFTVG